MLSINEYLPRQVDGACKVQWPYHLTMKLSSFVSILFKQFFPSSTEPSTNAYFSYLKKKTENIASEPFIDGQDFSEIC